MPAYRNVHVASRRSRRLSQQEPMSYAGQPYFVPGQVIRLTPDYRRQLGELRGSCPQPRVGHSRGHSISHFISVKLIHLVIGVNQVLSD
jgi:hypothetical protein